MKSPIRAYAVIGSSFGDEGKGLMVDYLSAKYNDQSIVVRYNGGCQAGHTVVDATSGKRHVFHHFGSGNFNNVPTYLSKFFVVHPMLIEREIFHIQKVSKTYVDGDCMVTTPYDMMINQIVEQHRAKVKHGSCGIGFGETIFRNVHRGGIRLTVQELQNEFYVRNVLDYIRKEYMPVRLKMLGVEKIPTNFKMLCDNDDILNQYIDDVKYLLDRFEIVNSTFLKKFKNVIFEGAQGLLLDEENLRYFPHVTRSKTGLYNIIAILNEIGVTELNANYVSRAYITRHGAGFLPYENFALPYPDIIDETNIFNEYQDSIRYGLLDIDELKNNIFDDMRKVKIKGVKIDFNLALTCLDQVNNRIKYYKNNILKIGTVDKFLVDIYNTFGVNRVYQSYGNTREHIVYGD